MHYFNTRNQPYPHTDESVLHYLTLTERMDFVDALDCLRDAVRHWQGLSKLSLGASGFSLLSALLAACASTTVAAGSVALIPLAAAAFAAFQAWGSRKELQVRAMEYEMLKSHTDLLELMLSAYRQGCEPLPLIRAYNRVVGAYSAESGDCQGVEPIAAFSQQMLHSNQQTRLFESTLTELGHTETVADIRFAPWLERAGTRYKPATATHGSYEPPKRLPRAPDLEPTPQDSSPRLRPQISDYLDHTEPVAMEVLNGLAGSRLSTLIIGGTGAGKSVTEFYLLTRTMERCPDAEIWAISQKNDSFCGLDVKGRVVLFDFTNVAATFAVIDRVWGIYDARRRMAEHQRDSLPPVRLVLADWLSINSALQDMRNDETVKASRYQQKLIDVLFNGRDFNVGLIIDLQSYNLLAIGIKSDRNSRQNFNIIGLGNYYIDAKGAVQESYGVLSNMLRDPNIVDDEGMRAGLIEEFRRLKAISMRHQRPILFTTLEPARVALTTDLRPYKARPNAPAATDNLTPEQLDRIYQLEFDMKAPDSPRPSAAATARRERKSAIIEQFKGKGPVKFYEVIASRQKFKELKVDDVKSLVAELVDEGKATFEGTNAFIINPDIS